jgi:hypothetical protein
MASNSKRKVNAVGNDSLLKKPPADAVIVLLEERIAFVKSEIARLRETVPSNSQDTSVIGGLKTIRRIKTCPDSHELASWNTQFPFLKHSNVVVVALRSFDGYHNAQFWGLEGTYLLGKVQASEGGEELWSSKLVNFDPGHLPPSVGLLKKFKNDINAGVCLYAEERRRRWGMVTTTDGMNKRVLHLTQTGFIKVTEVLVDEAGMNIVTSGHNPVVWECMTGSPHAAACLLPPVASLTVEDLATATSSDSCDVNRFLSTLQGGACSTIVELHERFAPLFSAQGSHQHWLDDASTGQGYEVVVTRGSCVIRLPQKPPTAATSAGRGIEYEVGRGNAVATSSIIESGGMDIDVDVDVDTIQGRYFKQAYPLTVAALLGEDQQQQYETNGGAGGGRGDIQDPVHEAQSSVDAAATASSVSYRPALYPALFVPLRHRASFLSNLSKNVAGRTIVLSGG